MVPNKKKIYKTHSLSISSRSFCECFIICDHWLWSVKRVEDESCIHILIQFKAWVYWGWGNGGYHVWHRSFAAWFLCIGCGVIQLCSLTLCELLVRDIYGFECRFRIPIYNFCVIFTQYTNVHQYSWIADLLQPLVQAGSSSNTLSVSLFHTVWVDWV